MKVIDFDPQDELPLYLHFHKFLGVGETISSVIWATDAPVVSYSPSISADGKTAITGVKVSGAHVENTLYKVNAKVTTSAGNKIRRSVYLKVAAQ